MKFTLKTVIIGISVVIVIVIYSALYALEEGLQAIVVQFGRPVGDGDSKSACSSGMVILTRFPPKGVSLSG
jgi:regulator of protease activity HflC (stomatin/prohibitin superfamily)